MAAPEVIVLAASLLCLGSFDSGLAQAAGFPSSLFFSDCYSGPATSFTGGEGLHH